VYQNVEGPDRAAIGAKELQELRTNDIHRKPSFHRPWRPGPEGWTYGDLRQSNRVRRGFTIVWVIVNAIGALLLNWVEQNCTSFTVVLIPAYARMVQWSICLVD